jgi:hypothetical protein
MPRSFSKSRSRRKRSPLRRSQPRKRKSIRRSQPRRSYKRQAIRPVYSTYPPKREKRVFNPSPSSHFVSLARDRLPILQPMKQPVKQEPTFYDLKQPVNQEPLFQSTQRVIQFQPSRGRAQPDISPTNEIQSPISSSTPTLQPPQRSQPMPPQRVVASPIRTRSPIPPSRQGRFIPKRSLEQRTIIPTPPTPPPPPPPPPPTPTPTPKRTPPRPVEKPILKPALERPSHQLSSHQTSAVDARLYPTFTKWIRSEEPVLTEADYHRVKKEIALPTFDNDIRNSNISLRHVHKVFENNSYDDYIYEYLNKMYAVVYQVYVTDTYTKNSAMYISMGRSIVDNIEQVVGKKTVQSPNVKTMLDNFDNLLFSWTLVLEIDEFMYIQHEAYRKAIDLYERTFNNAPEVLMLVQQTQQQIKDKLNSVDITDTTRPMRKIVSELQAMETKLDQFEANIGADMVANNQSFTSYKEKKDLEHDLFLLGRAPMGIM